MSGNNRNRDKTRELFGMLLSLRSVYGGLATEDKMDRAFLTFHEGERSYCVGLIYHWGDIRAVCWVADNRGENSASVERTFLWDRGIDEIRAFVVSALKGLGADAHDQD